MDSIVQFTSKKKALIDKTFCVYGRYWITSGLPAYADPETTPRPLPKASHPAIAGCGFFVFPLWRTSSPAAKQKSQPDYRLAGLVGCTGFEPVTPTLSK